MSTNWDRLEDIFAQAIEIDPAERAAFLDRKCGSAPALRAELESLLRAHDEAEISFQTRSEAVRDILGALGSSLLTGRTLGPYRIGPIIGEGGMGIVYQAVDSRQGTAVAVKVLPQELSLDSPWRKRFSREVRATAAIQHSNVVRILDYGEDAGCLFLAMELIPGESLRTVISRGALPLKMVLDYAVQMAAALEAAHAAGVIHHDFKPGNIMVTPAEELKVVDFGLSRFEDDSGGDGSRSRLSQVGTPAGTIDYLSPEQAGGRGVDARSDLFAFGSVLYEMLTGRRAFHRSTNLETAAAILRDRPEPLPDAVPLAVAGLVEKCLAKDAGRRFASSAELRSALEGLRARFRRGKLKARRFRRTRRIALWASAASVLTVATVFGLSRAHLASRSPLRFERLTDDPHVTNEPALSDDGRWLAYASDRAEDGNVDVWIQPTGQGSARRLTSNPAVDHQPALSPDGSMLAFRSEREPAGIYIMPAAGGAERLLVAGGRDPRFSPDGRWLAYWEGPDVNGDAQAVGHSAVFAIPAAGGSPHRLAADFSDAVHPVWSPDSTRLLFSGHQLADDPDTRFWTVSIDGGAPRLKARWPVEIANSIAPPQPFAWPKQGEVLLSWYRRESDAATHIWRMVFPQRPGSETPELQRLTAGPVPYTWCTTDRTGRIVVASGALRSAIWTLPVDADTAAVHGAMSPLVVEGERQTLLSATTDGKLVLFRAADRRGKEVYMLRHVDSGQQTEVGSGEILNSVRVTSDGRWACIEATAKWQASDLSQLVALPPKMGLRIFGHPSTQWDLSRDGREALATGVLLPRPVELESLEGEPSRILLQHPGYNLYLANFSPDNRWIVVTAENGIDQPRLFAVPFEPPYPIAISRWVDLGDGAFGSWAPSGKRIYFLREHQGSRCLYTQILDPVTKKPVGEAQAVLHFHSAWRSPLQLQPGYFRLMVARDKLVFLLGETQSNLWLSEPAGNR
jgi:serine/threonine protein kinase